MLKSSARPVIRLRGVRHNNLKNFDLDLPFNQLIVIIAAQCRKPLLASHSPER